MQAAWPQDSEAAVEATVVEGNDKVAALSHGPRDVAKPTDHGQPSPPEDHEEQSQAATTGGVVPRAVPPLLSTCLTRPPPSLPQALAADFEVDPGVMAEGAFAAVKRLRHRQSGSWAAMKVVEKQPLAIRDMLPQLAREVRIQGALRHRHILQLLSSNEDDYYVYMLFEYCAGGTLRSLCMSMPMLRLPENTAVRHFVQILRGVDYMHQCGCVHRDLKPDNVLLTGSGEVRICDFGWSAELQMERSLLTTCGTPNYWAPELFEGTPQTYAIDLWSLGNLIYELLIGHAPFWGTQEEIRSKVLAVDLRYPPDLLTHEAVHLFHCLLQRDPLARAPASWLLTAHPWVLAGVAALESTYSEGAAPCAEEGGTHSAGPQQAHGADDSGEALPLGEPAAELPSAPPASTPAAEVGAVSDAVVHAEVVALANDM